MVCWAFIHLKSNRGGTLNNVLPHKNVMPQAQDIPSRHSMQTQGYPVVVLFIDVQRHTGIHKYPF